MEESKAQMANIINKFAAKFNGKLVFSMSLEPSISSNPYVSFPFKVYESGKFELEWTEDGGEIYKLSKSVKVS